jgi:inner membrane protein
LLSQIASRIISELGPWLWMLSGFALMIVEIASGRAIALSFAMAAFIAGTVAVMGASGAILEVSNTVCSLIFAGGGVLIFAGLKTLGKPA